MSVSFRAVLSLWKPMGFMMSLRSVRMLYAIAPESSRVTLEYGQAVPYALTDTAFLGSFQSRFDFLNALGWLHGVHGVF